MISFPASVLTAKIVTIYSVNKTVAEVIRNNTNPQTVAQAAAIWTGSLVIGSMVASHASNYVEQTAWELRVMWQASKQKIKESKK